MSELNHVIKQRNTQFTGTQTSYTDVDATDALIPASFFTAGKKYLIEVSCVVGNAIGGNITRVRVVHGSTAFADSELIFAPASASSRRFKYPYFIVWTAVGGEDIKLQYNVVSGTAQLDFIFMQATNLSDNLTENVDWYSNENPGSDALSTTPVDGAAITVLPIAPSDWLVYAGVQLNPGDNTTLYTSTLNRSGEASSSVPSHDCTPTAADQQYLYLMARVFALTAVSNTFTEKSSLSTGTAHARLFSRVFALNLNKFAAHASVFTDTSNPALSASAYATEIQTLDITPTVTGTVFIGAQFQFNSNHYNPRLAVRGQTYVVGQSQVDQPAGQTAAALELRPTQAGSNDEDAIFMRTAMSMTAGNTYRTDIDGSVSHTTNTPTAGERSLWMFSAELAAVAGDTFVKLEIRAAP